MDYRESEAGKRRFNNPEIYQKTLEFQQYLRSQGIAWHNFYSNECTIDFDCCEAKSIGKVPVTCSVPSERIIVKTAFNDFLTEMASRDNSEAHKIIMEYWTVQSKQFIDKNYE